ncbi:hypothetical protein ABPG72_005360 [Tetrahymena utriculariae]
MSKVCRNPTQPSCGLPSVSPPSLTANNLLDFDENTRREIVSETQICRKIDATNVSRTVMGAEYPKKNLEARAMRACCRVAAVVLTNCVLCCAHPDADKYAAELCGVCQLDD